VVHLEVAAVRTSTPEREGARGFLADRPGRIAAALGGYGRGMDRVKVDVETDPILMSDVASLGSVDGPCVSLFMGTHRFGPETTTQDPVRLRNLVESARSAMSDAGTEPAVIDEILDPVSALVDDSSFWQHQSDGLAVFSARGRFERFRVQLPLAEEATVAGSFRVRPLLPAVTGDDRCFVLALSQKSVQLFEATSTMMSRLDSESLPESMDVALAFEDPERQLQSHSVGGRDVAFHGHGMGGEVDRDEVERFLRAVDRGVIEALGDARDPLVLACVESYLPIYRSVSRYPNVADEVIAGNPEHRPMAELHGAAQLIVQPHVAARTDAMIARFHSAAGTGNTADNLPDVLAAARDGRVAQLFVTIGDPVWGHLDEQGSLSLAARSIGDEDLVDRAVYETLAHHGEVVVTDPETLGASSAAAALLRY
jgi:hypothetical protein